MKSWHLLLGAGLLAGLLVLLLMQGPETPVSAADTGSAAAPPVAAAAGGAATAGDESGGRDVVRSTGAASPAGGTGLGSWVESGAAATVLARLVRADGQGAQGAVVRPADLQHEMVFLGMDGASASQEEPQAERKPVAADASGNVRLTVPAGEPLTLEFGGEFWRAQQRSVAALRPDEVVDLGEIALAPAARVAGIIEDAQGRPVAGADTQLRAADEGMFWEGHPVLQSAKSDATGAVHFDGVPVGRVRIEGQSTGRGRGVIESLAVPTAPGEVEFRLRLPDGAKLTGRAVDADRRPVPGARIYLSRSEQEIWWGDYVPPLPDREADAVSAADGSFELRGLPEDGSTATLLAGAEGFATIVQRNLHADSDVTLVLPPALAVRGRVMAEGDVPVADADVALSRTTDWGWEETKSMAKSEADGSFTLTDVEPGEYTLTASAQGGTSLPLKLKVDRPLADLLLRVAVRPALRVRVLDPDGGPLAGAQVDLSAPLASGQVDGQIGYADAAANLVLQDGAMQWSGTQRTDADGVAVFYGSPGGELQLEVRHPDWARHSETFQHSGAAAERTVTLQRPAALLVRAVDGAGGAVRGAVLRLREPGSGKELDERRTDAAGRAFWSDLTPGAYELLHGAASGANAGTTAWGGFIQLDTGESGSAPPPERGEPLLLVAGECLVKELILSDLAVATIRVTRGGAPAADVAVRIERIVESEETTMHFVGGLHGSGMGNRLTDARGRLVLDPVAAGRYAVFARPSRNAPETRIEADFTPGPCEFEVRLNGARVSGVVRSSQGPVVGARMSLAPWSPETADASHRRFGYSISIIGNGELIMENGNDGDSRASSDADGEYVFEDVPEGQWVVSSKAEGFAPWTSLPFTVTSGQDLLLPEQTLLPGGVIHGRDANWQPKGEGSGFGFDWNRAVRVETEAGEMIGMTQANDSGEYKIKDLSEGSYVVRYGDWKSEVIRIRPGQQERVDVPKVEPRKQDGDDEL